MILKEKIPFSIEIPMAGGLNKHDEPSLIGDSEFQISENVLFDRGITEKAKAFEKINQTALEGGAPIDGVCRCYSNTGTARVIVICNGKVYEGSDWETPIYTALTAGKKCTFEQYQGKTIISNGYDEPIVYDPKTNTVWGPIGIKSPYQIAKVAYFELDETGWNGGQADLEVHVLDEFTGDSIQGRRLTAAASNTADMYRTGTWDFSEFPDNGSITDWDIIDISTFHQIRKNVDTITIYFETSTGNYFSFSFDKESLDPDGSRDNEWTHHKIIRSRFAKTGSPSWSNITKIKISLSATADGQAVVTFDNWRIRRTPPVAGIFRKDIATFEEADETWTGGQADRNNYKDGGMGRKLTDGDETAYCDKSLDLTTWINGQSVFSSDEIRILAFVNDRSKVTSVTVKLGDSDLSNHYAKTWQQANLLNGTDLWNELEVTIGDMSSVGSPDWSSIARIQIEAVLSAGGEVTFDFWHAIQKGGIEGAKKQIIEIEKGESGVTWTESDSFVHFNNIRVGKGLWSMEFWRYGGLNNGWAKAVLDSPKDMTKWEDATDSPDDDFICYWQYCDEMFGQWIEVVLTIDCNTGDFTTDYFEFTVTKGYLENPNRAQGNYILIPKKEFNRVGTSAGKGWDTVKGLRWHVYVGAWELGGGNVFVHIDDCHMRRNLGLDGRYQWKTVFRYAEVRSPASGPSDWVDLVQMKALLTHIPLSPDERVKVREIYRRAYGDEEFRYAFTIPDNSSTQWWDDLKATTLTMDEMGVPSGTISSPKGIKVLEYRDSIILLQVLEDLKRIFHTKPGYIHAWSEDQARDFVSEVVGGIVHFDSIFLFLRNGKVYRIDDDIDLGTPHPLGDIIKAISPWGYCRVEENMAILTDDDIKLFTGYASKSIGEAIEPYLDQENYKTEEAELFYHKDHLYYAVETRSGGTYKLFDCYLPRVKWEDRNQPARCLCAYTGKGDKNELIMGSPDGFIYKLSGGYGQSFQVRSKDFGEVSTAKGKGFLFHEKELSEVRVIAKGGDGSSGSLTLELFSNGTATGISKTIPESGHLAGDHYHTYIIPLEGIEDAIIGQLIGFGIEHDTNLKNAMIKAVMLNGYVIPLEQEFTDG